MDIFNQRWHPLAGLSLFYFLFVLAGLILSVVYRFFVETSEAIITPFLAPIIMGIVLAGLVFGLKRFFKITWNIPALCVVLFAFTAVYFIMWGALPLQEALLPPTLFTWETPTIAHQIVAWLEVLVIISPALFFACQPSGVYLPNYNRWARIRLLDYGFKPFSDYELEQLSAGETDCFEHKPIDLTGLDRINGVALCYVDKKMTEYIAIFKANWNRQGYIERGKLLLLTPLTFETIELLQARLYTLHRESEQ